MRHYIRLFTIALLLSTAFASCGDDEPEPAQPSEPSQPTQPVKTTGTLTVEAPNNIPTEEHPAVATAQEPLELHLKQQSSYQDPNGSTYTCRPQATLKLEVQTDTVRARTLQSLLAFKENSENKNSGDNPKTKTILQTFTIGEQTVGMDLAYEIYTYKTSTAQSVEMPYVKLNPAKHGTIQHEERTRAEGETEAVLTGIRLTPLPMTRGTLINEQAYRVSLSFTVKGEAVHTEQPQTLTIGLEAEYVGIVENVTEYPDPTASLAYHAEVQGGTSNTNSPYVMDGAAQEMTITWQQDGRYTWFDVPSMSTKSVSSTPSAAVRVTLGMERPRLTLSDNHLVADLTQLPRVDYPAEVKSSSATEVETVTEGRVTTARRDFMVGGMPITLEWNYEASNDTVVEGTTVAMPYMVLDEPQVQDISIRRAEEVYWLAQDYEYNEGKEIYAVTVRIRQPLTMCNATNAGEDAVEYEITFLSLHVAPLVRVKYRRSVKWEDPHDNILLTSIGYIYRDRIYADGQKATDTFYWSNWNPAKTPGVDWGYRWDYWCDEEQDHMKWERAKIDYLGLIPSNPADERSRVDVGDSIMILYASMGVPDMSLLTDMKYDGTNDYDVYPDDFNTYGVNKLFTDKFLELNLDGIEVVGSDGPSDKQSGWYDSGQQWRSGSNSCIYESGKPYIESGIPNFSEVGGNYVIRHQYGLPSAVCALMIDGQQISFCKDCGEYQYDIRTEYLQATEERGPAKVITSEGRVKFLGKNFYTAVIDTIYQIKGSGRPYQERTRMVKNKPIHAHEASSVTQMPNSMMRMETHIEGFYKDSNGRWLAK